MFKKVLIANRGEIAIRVIRALREMKIPSLAVYSDADRNSLHRILADYAHPLDGHKVGDTYMNAEKILKIALDENVDAVHPGYGFLSENEEFARMLEQNGITFIGPGWKIIERMGNKIAARKMMKEAGIPTVPGSDGAVESLDEARSIAETVGYPLMLKAAAGGGGIGMRIVSSTEELDEMFARVQEQAASVFGDRSIFIEKYLKNARHIEVQVLADKHGNIVHLGERECSIQRRHQKIIEESPSPALDEATRQRMGAVAVEIAKVTGYNSAGTVEFIFSEKQFYFLEMNTRLQVEHPVTEMLTGIDIVKSQIKIAAGLTLPFSQDEIRFCGHSIECRVCAEDPFNSFMPSPGKINGYRSPGGVGVRVDSGVYFDYEITSYYDSMISKLVVWGENREEAVGRMRRSLREYIILGPKTNIPYLSAVMENGAFQSGDYNTSFVEQERDVFEHAKRIHNQMSVYGTKSLKDDDCTDYFNEAWVYGGMDS